MPSNRKGGNNDVFTVERLTNRRVRGGTVDYLVKWQNWSDKHNSWEPESNILDKRLIESYNELVARKAQQKRNKAMRSKSVRRPSQVREVPLPTRPSSELKRPAKERAELEISAMEKQFCSQQNERPKIFLTIPRDRILPCTTPANEDSSYCDEEEDQDSCPQTSSPPRLSFCEDSATLRTQRNLSCEVELPRRSTSYSLDYPPPPKLEAVHISEEDYDELNVSTNGITPRGGVNPPMTTTTSSATTPVQDDNNNRNRKKKKKKSSKRLRSPSSQSSKRHKHKKHRRKSPSIERPTTTVSPSLATPTSPLHITKQAFPKTVCQSENRLYRPNPERLKALNDIILTDVTVNNLTITFKECSGPTGFFGQPSPYTPTPLRRKEERTPSSEKKSAISPTKSIKIPKPRSPKKGFVEPKSTVPVAETPVKPVHTNIKESLVDEAVKKDTIEPNLSLSKDSTEKEPISNKIEDKKLISNTDNSLEYLKKKNAIIPQKLDYKPPSPQVSDAKVTSTSVSIESTKEVDLTSNANSTDSSLAEVEMKVVEPSVYIPTTEDKLLSSSRQSPQSTEVKDPAFVPESCEVKTEEDALLVVDDDDEEDRALTIDLNPPTPVSTPPCEPPPSSKKATPEPEVASSSTSVSAPPNKVLNSSTNRSKPPSLTRIMTVDPSPESPGVAIVPPQPQAARKSLVQNKRSIKGSTDLSDAKIFKTSSSSTIHSSQSSCVAATIASTVNSLANNAALYNNMSMYMRNPYSFGSPFFPPAPCLSYPTAPTTSDFYGLSANSPSPAHLCPSLGPYTSGHHAYQPLFQSQAALFHQQQIQQQQQQALNLKDDSPIDLSRKL